VRVGITAGVFVRAGGAAGLVVVEERGEIDPRRFVLQSVADAAYGTPVGLGGHNGKSAAVLLDRRVVDELILETGRIVVDAAHGGLIGRVAIEELPGDFRPRLCERSRLRLTAGSDRGAALVHHQIGKAQRGQCHHGDYHEDHYQDHAAAGLCLGVHRRS
jgi:hypothetical protein